MNGVNIFIVSKILCHTSTRTTEQFYLHLAPRQKAQAVGILNSAYQVKAQVETSAAEA